MALQNLSRAFVSSSLPPCRPSPAPSRLLHRRVPVIGALCILGLGAISSLTYNTVCGQSIRQFPFARTKFLNQPSSRGLQSAAMASASTTVPSIVVYVTVPNKEAGMKLAESIIKEKLAACVNRVPGIESVYWWDGKVQTDSEELLIIKTRESLLSALTEHVKANHEYEVPEIIALPITGGSEKYLEWIKNSTRDS